MKDILLHVHDDPTFEHTLESALALARAHGAHLHCLQASPLASYLDFMAIEPMASVEERLGRLDLRQDELQAELARQLDQEDVGWSYDRQTGDMVEILLAQSGLCDLLVVSRGNVGDRKSRRERMEFLGDLVLRSRTPIFIPNDGPRILDPLGPAVVAWDGSYEAANALRGALPILKMASSVTVIRVEEKKKRQLFPDTRVLRYLSSHAIKAELVEEAFTEEWVDEILVAHAIHQGASTIVSGGYGHSRLGEYLFGGTTRALLSDCPVGLVIAH